MTTIKSDSERFPGVVQFVRRKIAERVTEEAIVFAAYSWFRVCAYTGVDEDEARRIARRIYAEVKS